MSWRYWDVSVPLKDGMVCWPGDAAPRLEQVAHMDRGDMTSFQDVMNHAKERSANNFNVNENDCQLDLYRVYFIRLGGKAGIWLIGLSLIVIWRAVWVGGVCKGLLLNISLGGCKSRHAGLIESGMDVGWVALYPSW